MPGCGPLGDPAGGGITVRAVPGGVLVEVRVRPRSRPGWQITAGALVIRVAGAPVGGAATEEARRARQGPRRGTQPGVPAARRALPDEGVRGRRCGRRGGEDCAQEGRERSPGSWWSRSSCLKSEFEHASRPATNIGASVQTDRPSTAMEQDPEGCTVVKLLFTRDAASTG